VFKANGILFAALRRLVAKTTAQPVEQAASLCKSACGFLLAKVGDELLEAL
jgi:hypothetical protein